MSKEIELLQKQLVFWKHQCTILSKSLTDAEETANHYANMLDKTEEELNDERVKNEEQVNRKYSEAIDEFAKRLKEKMNDLSRLEYDCVPYFLVSKSFIDKIAKDMKGGE